MSQRERKAYRRYESALREAAREDFIMTQFPVDDPRETERQAVKLARVCHGKDRVVLNELAAAAQGYADVHDRANRERARQRSMS